MTGEIYYGRVRAVADPIEYEGNAKLHPRGQIAIIKASVQRLGFNDPIGVNPEDRIIEDSGRPAAAHPVVVNDGVTVHKAEAQYAGQ